MKRKAEALDKLRKMLAHGGLWMWHNGTEYFIDGAELLKTHQANDLLTAIESVEVKK